MCTQAAAVPAPTGSDRLLNRFLAKMWPPFLHSASSADQVCFLRKGIQRRQGGSGMKMLAAKPGLSAHLGTQIVEEENEAEVIL